MKKLRPDGILQTLNRCGYEAYYVGGCVRDTLIGRNINDWDITTSASPEQITACFDHCIPTGIKHGTVTVLMDGAQAEVTTYRTEGEYLDGRHPSQVQFVKNLAEDLARRDFTINAMAMDLQGNVIDLYGGQKDLQNKLIRCVGDPQKRFREDALRMLRAVRFSAQLEFEIHEQTRQAICSCAEMSEKLSAERVRDEMEKTICSKNPERINEMAKLGLLHRCMPSPERDASWFSTLSAEPVVRWAALCRIWPQMDLGVLRLSKKITNDAMEAGRCAVPDNELAWKKLIAEHGAERAKITAALEGKELLVHALLSSGQCLTLRELAVTGGDFPHMTGAEIGKHLKALLFHVLEHPEDNKKEVLLTIK